jgi:hypothetical protein
MNETFLIPLEWEGQQVLVALRQALVNSPQGPGYLAVRGTLRSVHDTSIIFETDVASLLGPPGTLVVPKNCLAWVNRLNSVVVTNQLPKNNVSLT